jgi:hypothetical protein
MALGGYFSSWGHRFLSLIIKAPIFYTRIVTGEPTCNYDMPALQASRMPTCCICYPYAQTGSFYLSEDIPDSPVYVEQTEQSTFILRGQHL